MLKGKVFRKIALSEGLKMKKKRFKIDFKWGSNKISITKAFILAIIMHYIYFINVLIRQRTPDSLDISIKNFISWYWNHKAQNFICETPKLSQTAFLKLAKNENIKFLNWVKACYINFKPLTENIGWFCNDQLYR